MAARYNRFARMVAGLLTGLFATAGWAANFADSNEAWAFVEAQSARIAQRPEDPTLYVERGDALFQLHEFDRAIEDFSAALRINPSLDDAWFGRGLARGRAGLIDEGIADLTVYISRHPDNSRAYTKRGVRYLWQNDDANAERDLRRALELDPGNAEAHDDLGVVLARRGDNFEAYEHFFRTVSLDPTYQKGFHNLAMIYFITEQDELALTAVNEAVRLSPNNRNTLLLKVEILKVIGRLEEAAATLERAEFLPGGDWSEEAGVR